MKKSITFLISYFFIISSFAASKAKVDSALVKLYEALPKLQLTNINPESYAELAYLKRVYNLKELYLNDSAYKSMIMNNYYYDQFYLYSKLLNENAVVSEDCLHNPESTETLFPMWKKLLIYSLYPKSIKMPTNMVELIDEYATFDEFFGPYYMLNTIYFLKKYNYQNLSAQQKANIKKIEDRLSTNLLNKYVNNKPWSLSKILAIKVLMMNENTLIKIDDIDFLLNSFINNKTNDIISEDLKDTKMLSLLGARKFYEMGETALLWIFLLEKDKN
jgi:hypothetical protein